MRGARSRIGGGRGESRVKENIWCSLIASDNVSEIVKYAFKSCVSMMTSKKPACDCASVFTSSRSCSHFCGRGTERMRVWPLSSAARQRRPIICSPLSPSLRMPLSLSASPARADPGSRPSVDVSPPAPVMPRGPADSRPPPMPPWPTSQRPSMWEGRAGGRQ